MKRVLLLLVLSILACNDQPEPPKETNVKSVETVKKPRVLEIKFSFESNAPEDIKLIANDIFLNNAQAMDLYITQRIAPNETAKDVVFKLPENIVPDFNIGISLGTKKVKEVKIKSVVISIGDLLYDIGPKDLMTYFRPNKFINYDEDAGILKTSMIDGKHNPVIFLRKPYVDKIESTK